MDCHCYSDVSLFYFSHRSKFGLYEVDFQDPMRTRRPRASAHFYKTVIRTHSLDIDSSDAGIKISDELYAFVFFLDDLEITTFVMLWQWLIRNLCKYYISWTNEQVGIIGSNHRHIRIKNRPSTNRSDSRSKGSVPY